MEPDYYVELRRLFATEASERLGWFLHHCDALGLDASERAFLINAQEVMDRFKDEAP